MQSNCRVAEQIGLRHENRKLLYCYLILAMIQSTSIKQSSVIEGLSSIDNKRLFLKVSNNRFRSQIVFEPTIVSGSEEFCLRTSFLYLVVFMQSNNFELYFGIRQKEVIITKHWLNKKFVNLLILNLP